MSRRGTVIGMRGREDPVRFGVGREALSDGVLWSSTIPARLSGSQGTRLRQDLDWPTGGNEQFSWVMMLVIFFLVIFVGASLWDRSERYL